MRLDLDINHIGHSYRLTSGRKQRDRGNRLTTVHLNVMPVIHTLLTTVACRLLNPVCSMVHTALDCMNG
jgi:hypothetical protein